MHEQNIHLLCLVPQGIESSNLLHRYIVEDLEAAMYIISP